MKTQLYLWHGLRERKKEELSIIKVIYFDKISPIFENAEEEANKYYNEVSESLMSNYHPDYNDIDPYNVYKSALNASLEKYEVLSLMRYRNLAMWISSLCQVWEQQLMKFLKAEMKHDGYEFDDKGLEFKDIKEAFKMHNVDLEKLECWKHIKELRWLVNVLKHGDGNSAKSLRKARPDLFKSEYDGKADMLEFHDSSVLEVTLKINNNDFLIYHDALIEFWDELPDRMYSDDIY
jgi:hypothetical protein